MFFDVVVIGAGPGGYVAAIRAAQNGAKVALVEAGDLGGTCLNVGCIPTKTLISSAEVYSTIKRSEQWGVKVGQVEVDFAAMAQRKNKVISSIRGSLEGLLRANKIEIIKGFGKVVAPGQVKVLGEKASLLETKGIILATGSKPRNIGAFPFDPPLIHSSTSILELSKLPKSLVVVGGGVIGCEAACLYAELGVKVTILELLPTLLSTEPPQTAQFLTKTFEKRGIIVRTKVNVDRIDKQKKGVLVHLVGGEQIEAEMALVAIGREINTENIGLEALGIATTKGGFIAVNERMETAIAGIWAIGDITGKALLAHVASHQGLVAADNATGKAAKMDYRAIPSVVYTHPEAASVGMTLEQAKAAGYQAEQGQFPFEWLGRSIAAGHPEGYASVVIDKRTGAVLGASAVCHDAGTLIAQMTQAIANELTGACIEHTIHPHPTTSEAWLEATLLAAGHPLHLPPRSAK
ncbi:MAG: dihydrolipoyl dehydrogenase [Verrucomicrobia bacterium]|nr:dihydrolipoyl dehydrogenase [Verrucomicrobiota bacterium]